MGRQTKPATGPDPAAIPPFLFFPARSRTALSPFPPGKPRPVAGEIAAFQRPRRVPSGRRCVFSVDSPLSPC
jgi:hypothetical protein